MTSLAVEVHRSERQQERQQVGLVRRAERVERIARRGTLIAVAINRIGHVETQCVVHEPAAGPQAPERRRSNLVAGRGSTVLERAIQSEFENARTVQTLFKDPRITIKGNITTVTGLRIHSLVTQDGQRLSSVTRTTMTLRRSGDAWVIERVVHQQ